MSDLINGRTLEEIRAAVINCDEHCSCIDCPEDERDYCDQSVVIKYARCLIEHLESERDAALAKVPKWTSVEDRKKPRHGRECLCVCTMPNDPKHEWDYQMVLKWYAYGSNGLVDRPHFQHEGCEGMTVTHWMPLPEPPKEGE